MLNLKIIIMGYGRHGKDTVAQILHDKYGLKFKSSSEFIGERAVWPLMKYSRYMTFKECFEDRHNHRKLWHDAIKEYNKDDKAKLGKELFQEFDLYVGLRSKEELEALKDWNKDIVTIWVDRNLHCPREDENSCTVSHTDCTFYLDNNHTLEELENQIDELAHFLLL